MNNTRPRPTIKLTTHKQTMVDKLENKVTISIKVALALYEKIYKLYKYHWLDEAVNRTVSR